MPWCQGDELFSCNLNSCSYILMDAKNFWKIKEVARFVRVKCCTSEREKIWTMWFDDVLWRIYKKNAGPLHPIVEMVRGMMKEVVIFDLHYTSMAYLYETFYMWTYIDYKIIYCTIA